MIIIFWYWTMEKCSLCSGGRIRFLMGYCPLTDDHRSDTALSECIIIVSISPPGAWKWSAGGHCPMMYRFPVSWRQLSQYGWFVEFRANDRVNTQHQQTSDRVNTQHQPVTGLTLSTSQWQGRHHVNQRMLSAETWGRESRGQVPGGREEVKLLPAQVLLSPSTLLSSQTHTRQDQIKICNRQGLWGANLNRNILYPYGRDALGNGFGRWIHP